MSKNITALKATKAMSVASPQMIWQEQNALAEIKNIYGKDLTEGEFSRGEPVKSGVSLQIHLAIFGFPLVIAI